MIYQTESEDLEWVIVEGIKKIYGANSHTQIHCRDKTAEILVG